MKKIFAIILLAGAAFSAFAIDPDAEIKKINEYRNKQFADLRASGKQLTQADVSRIDADIEKMAKDAVKGESADKIDAAKGLAWGLLFQLANDPKSACRAAERFLETKPEPVFTNAAVSLMLSSCNELGEGKMLRELIGKHDPGDFQTTLNLASQTAYLYADTIRKSEGLDAALKTIETMTERVMALKPADEKQKASQLSYYGMLMESKAEFLEEAGRKKEALAALDSAISTIGESNPSARGLKGAKARMALLGATAPTLTFEKSYGTFTGLDSLKGKVVILDFFAHWCGPCIASFPDMKKLYADLQPKGLEIVGFTTYYGYYKTENRDKRDMAKDVEFGKMGEFIKEHALPWPVVYGERTNFEAYGVTGIPHVAVIGRDGNIHKIKVGYSKDSFAEFRKEIEKLVGK